MTGLDLFQGAVTVFAGVTYAIVHIRLRRERAKRHYDAAYRDGHRQGILDAVPWNCGCGRRNPGNRLMCGSCGADRFDLTDEYPKEC